MDEARLRGLLQDVAAGQLDVAAAVERLRVLPFEDLGYAKIDHHRALRTGFPEVVFCQNKTAAQIVGIMRALHGHADVVLGTRADAAKYEVVRAEFAEAVFHEAAGAIQIGGAAPREGAGPALVVCAGTSDIPVAEEAAVVLEAAGCETGRVYDVGVAGLHRLLDHRDRLAAAQVLVVVAGMEGALASVVGGLVSKPVIAVPTSVGYGASFGGVAALLSMLNSCASGVVVVNIDNGFGAGYFAAMLCRQLASARTSGDGCQPMA
jgi:pyridinium-3,5-biscarboxylic acid mononucleotide synthase